MGRHRKRATQDNGIIDEKHNSNPTDAVEKRLGLTKQVCQRCDARNSETADKCRKCGHTALRPKASQYRDA